MSLLPSPSTRALRTLAWGSLLAAAMPAAAGVVFREIEVSGAGPREVRQVSAQDDNCRIVQEESADPLAPAGSWILVTANDAFIVDPARSMIAPVAPTAMQPVAAEDRGASAEITGVTLEKLVDEAGPVLIGLPTRHYVYRLRYREEWRAADARSPIVVSHEERQEFWATPWPGGGEGLGTWRAWRVAEDAGAAAERREIREAVDSLYDHGLFLRQLVERREAPGTAPVDAAPVAKLTREVTAVSTEPVPASAFERPQGFALSEFLAPPPGEPDEAGAPGEAAPPGDAAGPEPPGDG